MAVIVDRKIESQGGLTKELDDAALSMIMDNLQMHIYNKPIQSCIKETVSNALDSNREKAIATKILTGEAQVSDFFVEKDGDIYKSSKFNKDYYDLNYFSNEDSVDITYISTLDALGRDRIIIEDHGVGLGDDRLFGFFTIGYSSKRLSNKYLGAFGLGCKSPLSTGVDSYTLISNHNGRQFKFEVFSQKIDCVYSKWNEDGSENKYISYTSKDGKEFRAYYVETTEKNGVRIMFDVKKHNKPEFIRAVKSQLQYIKEQINFCEQFEYSDGTLSYKKVIDVKNEIIFEDDNIILGKDSYYTKPHFVINNVIYNVIDFQELELPERLGNVGIKVSVEEVDLPPSRENVIYTPKTKAIVIEKMKSINETASNYIHEKLNAKEMSFRDWNDSFIDMLSDRGTVINRLHSLIDDGETKGFYDGLSFKFRSSLSYGAFIDVFTIPYINRSRSGATETYKRTAQSMIKLSDKKVYAIHTNMGTNSALVSLYNNKLRHSSNDVCAYMVNNVGVITHIIEAGKLTKDDFGVGTYSEIKDVISDIQNSIYYGEITTRKELEDKLNEAGEHYDIFFTQLYKCLLFFSNPDLVRVDKEYLGDISDDEIEEVKPKVRNKPVAGTFNIDLLVKSDLTSTDDVKYQMCKLTRAAISNPDFNTNMYYGIEKDPLDESILNFIKRDTSIINNTRYGISDLSNSALFIGGKNVCRIAAGRSKWIEKSWLPLRSMLYTIEDETIILTDFGASTLYRSIIGSIVTENNVTNFGVPRVQDGLNENLSKLIEVGKKLNDYHTWPVRGVFGNVMFTDIIRLYKGEISEMYVDDRKVTKIEFPYKDIVHDTLCIIEYMNKIRPVITGMAFPSRSDNVLSKSLRGALENFVMETEYLKDFYIFDKVLEAEELETASSSEDFDDLVVSE